MSLSARRTTRITSSSSATSIPTSNNPKVLRQTTNVQPSQPQKTSSRMSERVQGKMDPPSGPPVKMTRSGSTVGGGGGTLSRTSSRLDINSGGTVKTGTGTGRIRVESRGVNATEKEAGDVNIEVVVRCRGRSAKEIAEKSPIVVTTTPSAPTVVLETTAPSTLLTAISSSSTILSSPKRTYSFDKVFGPEADQEEVYREVVQEAVDEVLAGYNCTIFAYGQTGTGKTHTMQGDLAINPDNTVSYEAGIIPRTLHSLFHYLDSNPLTEYSVKISYVELYNEEIRDLLTHGTSPAAPFGGGSNTAGTGGLKIFDDQKGKGVLIQGVEERGIESAKGGLNLLKIGSERRETGETLMNKASSRSHSIFTITVHLKETSSATGEELLKVGKFNLVDLAGSENVGRSGAEGDRAAEAGMINRSLLTLGRVINALVDKSRHVPYRESKLTRLLQDSLGGRTKTRIVATISPSRSNLEETISTLDYAMRATRIMNRPEANQRMTKNSLIRDYVLEIERLKADLMASREKNGVYKSEQEWLEWENEKALRETEAKEALHKSIQLESKLHSLKTRLDDQLELFVKKESELGVAREEIGRRVDELVQKEEELMGVKGALEVELKVAEKFEEGERQLDSVAGELKTVATTAVGDLEGVFGKLGRRGAVMSANEKLIASHGAKSSQCSQAMISQLGDLQVAQRKTNAVISGTLEEFKQRNLQSNASQVSRLNEDSVKISSAASSISRTIDRSATENQVFSTKLQSGHSQIEGSFRVWAGGLKSQIGTHVESIRENVSNKLREVHGPLKESVHSFDLLDSSVQTFLEAERAARAAERVLLARQMEEDSKSLEVSLSQLSQAYEADAASSKALRSKLLSLVNDLFDERDSASSRRFNSALEQHQVLSSQLEERHEAVWQERDTRETEGKRIESVLQQALAAGRGNVLALREQIPVLVSKAVEELSTCNQDLVQQTSSSLDVEMQEVESILSSLSQVNTGHMERMTKVCKKQKTSLDSMVATAHSSNEDQRTYLLHSAEDLEKSASAVLSSQSNLHNSLSTFQSAQTTSISVFRASAEDLVSNFAEDIPTGSTPQKRAWTIRDRWARTGQREQVRRALFNERRSDSRNDESSERHSPGTVDNTPESIVDFGQGDDAEL
ncbi:Kinesin-like protein [Phaffia rhodozyma]|uniref:Kinesin-like protein n=1 Tax=Phaffia rhodozyma TaxID=264483 RepID=A0A0F7SQ18_PHARH|nr:Kinesin-like protein [Phaffia rhodozyma]